MLKEYEIKVIRLFLRDILSPEQIEEVSQNCKFGDFEYTGSGYFLSVKHPILSKERIVCSRPILVGKTEDGIVCGFVLYIEKGQLTIECHSWGEINVPGDFRERDVQITIDA